MPGHQLYIDERPHDRTGGGIDHDNICKELLLIKLREEIGDGTRITLVADHGQRGKAGLLQRLGGGL